LNTTNILLVFAIVFAALHLSFDAGWFVGARSVSHFLLWPLVPCANLEST